MMPIRLKKNKYKFKEKAQIGRLPSAKSLLYNILYNNILLNLNKKQI